jgi:hypothetical protein
MSDPRTAWDWRPSGSEWYNELLASVDRWLPDTELHLDREILVEATRASVGRSAPWLFHPCVNLFAVDSEAQDRKRDIQFAAWIAGNVDLPPTTIRVPKSTWIWSPSGVMPVAAGDHDLRVLGAATFTNNTPCPITLDVWCDTVGIAIDGSWAQGRPSAAETEQDLPAAISAFMRAVSFCARYTPQCFDWITALTKVAVPLRGTRSHSRSVSFAAFPGLVCLTFSDTLGILEALVHETAHQYLFYLRARRSFGDPLDTVRYPSPLRPDPRPLGAVLGAFHALTYIAALHTDISRSYAALASACERRLASLRVQADDAERTLTAQRSRLTPLGRSVFDATISLASGYGLLSRAAC